MNAVLKEQAPVGSSVLFDRHFVSVTVANGMCEACRENRPGLAILPASGCYMQICAHCFFDINAAALSLLAREYAKWARS